MKTIFIATSEPGRARADYFLALGESFSKEGYRVVIIIGGRVTPFPRHETTTFLRWPTKRPTKAKDFIFLVKLIKKYRPSILISSFGSVNIMNLCGYITGVKNRINYVLSVSDLIEMDSKNSKGFKSNFIKYRKKIVYKSATLLVANSTGMVQDLKRYYGLDSNILVLPNLIIDSPIPYVEEEERKQQILIVGNLIKLKGHAILLTQFKNTLKMFPKLKLVIIGKGPEKQSLQSQTKDLGLNQSVEFLDYVQYRELGEYFAESLLHVSASINEAFGFVNLEAMREGTPIIVTRSAGGLELLKERRNGCFFELDDENSLIKAVQQILGNWKTYSMNARKDFIEKYELNSKIDTHKALLKSRLN